MWIGHWAWRVTWKYFTRIFGFKVFQVVIYCFILCGWTCKYFSSICWNILFTKWKWFWVCRFCFTLNNLKMVLSAQENWTSQSKLHIKLKCYLFTIITPLIEPLFWFKKKSVFSHLCVKSKLEELRDHKLLPAMLH